ncbi:zinc-binding dehydrogenase [Novosphingobium sp. PhB165]|uniref:zinc-binding dehydrogenase n=1 Tax=Novosphingobium sp. PhB165 TaxID=2485105 RepID=UPI001053F187|nr:zinc-binding dehydrogenase [Novosphingobium sp. PhB165]TCM16521.1 zinc-binding dehydrogenase [Novosphingobium sp. PhB165]
MTLTNREMRSRIDQDGTLTLSLESVALGEPGDDEVIVRIEAAPINPSDLGLLLGPADITTLETADGGSLRFQVPESRLPGVSGRIGQSLPIGNEGAGTVIAAGRNAKALQGKLVGMIGGGMYADYRRIAARDVVVLPEGASAADGAAMFVNPLTALGFVETAHREGHKAIVHTAAASNLGQMLQKICLADGIALVNVVRSPEQAQILRDIGAQHVVNSRDEDFTAQLTAAIRETGATIAFDAIGGGALGSDILSAMERAAVDNSSSYSRYGSDTFKQLYIYGALDLAPTTLNRMTFGFQWSAGGWLLFPFLQKAGADVAARLRARVLAELTTTFASRYTQVVGLAQALQPDVLRGYERKATGEKFLIDPRLG